MQADATTAQRDGQTESVPHALGRASDVTSPSLVPDPTMNILNNEDETLNYAKWEEYRQRRLAEYPTPQSTARYDIELTDPQNTLEECWHINAPHHPVYKTHYQCDHWYTITPIFTSIYPGVLGHTLDVETFEIRKGIMTRYGKKLLAQGHKHYSQAAVNVQPTSSGIFYAPYKPKCFVAGTPALRTIIQSRHPCHPHSRLNPDYAPHDKNSKPDYTKDCHQIEMHSTACRIECEPWGKNKQNHYAHFDGHYWTVSWIQPLQEYGSVWGYPLHASPPRENSVESAIDWYLRINHPEFNLVTHADNGHKPGGALRYNYSAANNGYIITRVLYHARMVIIDIECPSHSSRRKIESPHYYEIEMANPDAFNQMSQAIHHLDQVSNQYVDG